MARYYSANEYFKSIYNEKIYKISLDGGMSCPNRVNGTSGCIFCSEGGSGEFAIKYNGNIKEEIDDAINLVKNKKATKFIAYFQSYTNTFAPINYLRDLFYKAIEDDRIVGLSIATRPDSISDECIALLKELSTKKKVFIELGLQTSNDSTSIVIKRGYLSKKYLEITKKLRDSGINVITHLIIGLPGETKEDLINSINFINNNTDGVKLHLLYILKNTELENMYKRGEYTPLSMDEYIKLLGVSIKHLNPNIVVHRITGDPPKKLLVEPTWSKDKKHVLNTINKYFNDNNIVQGQLFNQ